MKALVIYDSTYGNTEQIAQAIAEGTSAEAVKVSQASDIDWSDVGTLIIGSPTQGGMPTKPLQELIKSIPENGLANIIVAGFDTRFDVKKQNIALKLLMSTIKYAAEKIARQLKNKGGTGGRAEGFIVTDKEGPLAEGELERAHQWGQSIVKKIDN